MLRLKLCPLTTLFLLFISFFKITKAGCARTLLGQSKNMNTIHKVILRTQTAFVIIFFFCKKSKNRVVRGDNFYLWDHLCMICIVSYNLMFQLLFSGTINFWFRFRYSTLYHKTLPAIYLPLLSSYHFLTFDILFYVVTLWRAWRNFNYTQWTVHASKVWIRLHR